MTTRNTPTQYDAPARNPAAGSVYAYLRTGLSIADAEPRLPDWTPPIATDREMDPVVRAYFERTNERRAWVEQRLITLFLDKLRGTSISVADLEPPYSLAVQGLMVEHLAGQRALLLHLELQETNPPAQGPDSPGYDRRLAVRTIVGAQFMAGLPRSSNELCDYLNRGHRGHERALTRHSLRSAWRTFRDELKSEGEARVQLLFRDVECLRALESLRQRAPNNGRFRQLRGEELALAIHEDFDLNESIWRAGRRLRAEELAQTAG